MDKLLVERFDSDISSFVDNATDYLLRPKSDPNSPRGDIVNNHSLSIVRFNRKIDFNQIDRLAQSFHI